MPAADSSYDIQIPTEEAALDWLVRKGELTPEDIDQAQALRDSSQRSLLVTLNQIGVLGDAALSLALQQITGLPIHEGEIRLSVGADCAINPDYMRDTQCLLLSDQGPLLVVDPLNERMLRGVEFALGFLPPCRIVRSGDWLRVFQTYYPGEVYAPNYSETEDDEFAQELADQNRDAPIVRQVSAWLGDAADLGASDIHFDARRNSLAVHYRTDGMLRQITTQPKALTASVIARIKVMADLDLGERNRPQDGRATIVVRGRRLDVRVSIIPTIDGESAVVRLLDRPDGLLSLEQLGFTGDLQSQLKAITDQRHGMFIVAGPTGSGKTTTLYACIEQLKGRGLKILSVEDPVEYHFDHVSQVQISEKAGRDFASALRAFLRHDPDVILVGEIRDSETAQIAVQASLSGHLVLATIHAIDTARVKARLTDMGVEPFKLDACMLGSMAQRLVRLLCPHCAHSAPLSPLQAKMFTDNALPIPDEIKIPNGCSNCHNEGYRGRTVIAELQTNSSQNQSGSLMRYALELVALGKTSISEIAGVNGQ